MENYNKCFTDCLNDDRLVIEAITGSTHNDSDTTYCEYKVKFFGPISSFSLQPKYSAEYKQQLRLRLSEAEFWRVTSIDSYASMDSSQPAALIITIMLKYKINKQGDLKMDLKLSNLNTLNAATCSVFANSPTYGSISICEDTSVKAKREEPDESVDTKSRVVEGLGTLKLVTYKDGYKAKTLDVAKPKKIDFFGNGRGVKVTYADGTSEKAVLAIDTEEERQEAAIAICALKKLLGDLTTQGYGSNLYNKLMEQTIKIDKKNKKEAADRKAKKVEENARKAKRAEKRRKKLIKKYASILAEVVSQSGLNIKKD